MLAAQGMSTHSQRKFLDHQHLNTTQLYTRIYDATTNKQFKAAISSRKAIAIDGKTVDCLHK